MMFLLVNAKTFWISKKLLVFKQLVETILTYEYERQEPAPRHGPDPLVPVFPALRAGRVPVRP